MFENGLSFRFVLCLLCLVGSVEGYAQWGAPYANSWISYDKPYVKILVAKKGIHRIPFGSLPATFSTAQPEKLQLWRRGKQVAILSVANNEILFYGVPNDGATDSLLYRPMSARINPYFSMYSDQSAYFLVNGDTAGLRAQNSTVTSSGALLPYATGKNPNIYLQEYNLTTEFPVRPNFFNSFFELAASRGGKVQLGGKLISYPFTLSNLVAGGGKTSVKLLVHGRSNNTRGIEVYIGKDEQSLRLVTTLNNSGFAGTEYSFDLNATDLTADGKGVLAVKAVSTDPLNRFSLAYFVVSYPRDFNMAGSKTLELTLPAAAPNPSRVSLKNAPVDARVLNISNPDAPIVVPGNLADLTIPTAGPAAADILVTNEIITVDAAKVSLAQFKKYDLSTSNYVIITSENILEGAGTYATYRASSAGGGYKTAVVNIKDIYDQFNYGEPSPVGIRRFADYLTSVGPKDKYVLLLGRSITHNERMKRELPDEVPTVGYPGSDILLVEGLGGVPQDAPAFPIGRIPAVNNNTILDYLQKVKDYESNAYGDIGWRKRVLHLNGGKTSSEVTQLKNMLGALVPIVTQGAVGGKVTPFVKQQGISEVEKVNITPEVNGGVGMITYFGHGSVTVTDLDMGYATDEARTYSNNLRYPMMYFNGCGVGNIFSGRFNPAPNTNDRYSLSMDWLLAARRGAIAVVANSFESFVSPSEKYLRVLYETMFTDASSVNQTIGKIQQTVAKKILADDRGTYSVANIHQTVLQGDPALRLVTVEKADYALDPDESISFSSEFQDKTIEKSENLRLRVVMANEGRFLKDTSVPVDITFHYTDGTSTKSQVMPSFAYSDTLELVFANTGKAIQRIAVMIDPKSTLAEMSRKNNIAELQVDWEVAKNDKVYPATAIKDVVPPVLSVNFNGRMLKNNEVIFPNPVISVTMLDDRLVSTDTSLIDLFIKPCQDESCKFRRINYSNVQVLHLDSVGTHSIRLVYSPTDIVPGDYELLVNAKDAAGNTMAQPYHIYFSVKEDAPDMNISVSPNPTSSYAHFETVLGKPNAGGYNIAYAIYDTRGILMLKNELKAPKTEKFDWYVPLDALSAGLYVYKVSITGRDGQGASVEKSGKIAVVK